MKIFGNNLQFKNHYCLGLFRILQKYATFVQLRSIFLIIYSFFYFHDKKEFEFQRTLIFCTTFCDLYWNKSVNWRRLKSSLFGYAAHKSHTEPAQ